MIPTECVTDNCEGHINGDTSEDSLHLWLSGSEIEVIQWNADMSVKVKIM